MNSNALKKTRLWVVVANSTCWKITSVKTSSCHSVETEGCTVLICKSIHFAASRYSNKKIHTLLVNWKTLVFDQLRRFKLSEKAQASKLLTLDVLIVLNIWCALGPCNYWLCYSYTTNAIVNHLTYWFICRKANCYQCSHGRGHRFEPCTTHQ